MTITISNKYAMSISNANT